MSLNFILLLSKFTTPPVQKFGASLALTTNVVYGNQSTFIILIIHTSQLHQLNVTYDGSYSNPVGQMLIIIQYK